MSTDDNLLHFSCPVCHAKLKTESVNADMVVQCAECMSDLVVPDPLPNQKNDKLVAEEAPLPMREPMEETEMDMTPMVDVTFLLLIFFMVTAAFTMQKSFEIPAPEDDRPSENVVEKEEEEGVITVRIDEYNTFFVSATHWDEEKEAPSEQELRRSIREAKEDGDGTVNTMIVEAHVDASHEKVVLAMDLGTDFQMEQTRLKTIETDG